MLFDRRRGGVALPAFLATGQLMISTRDSEVYTKIVALHFERCRCPFFSSFKPLQSMGWHSACPETMGLGLARLGFPICFVFRYRCNYAGG